eukprot:91321-Rhodomonas_salina.2
MCDALAGCGHGVRLLRDCRGDCAVDPVVDWAVRPLHRVGGAAAGGDGLLGCALVRGHPKGGRYSACLSARLPASLLLLLSLSSFLHALTVLPSAVLALYLSISPSLFFPFFLSYSRTGARAYI